MPTHFFLSESGERVKIKIPNGKTKNLMGFVLGAAVVGSFSLLAYSAHVASAATDAVFKQEIYDGIHVITVMTIGAFLALVKDIFNPRREIEIEDIMQMLDKMFNVKSANIQDNKTPQKSRRVI